jgi:hypothetical protein
MSVTTIESHSGELQEWKQSLQFFASETRLFENQLEEVVNNCNNKEILAEAEHFQNQFILQKEQFDLLKHDLNEIPKTHKHAELNNQIQAAEKIFKETRRSFYFFLSQVL